MGLIWGLKMEDGQRKGTRLMKKDVETPMVTNIYLYDGHFKADDQTQLDDRQPLASGVVNRWYLGSHVKRTVVKEGRLYATFFIPEGTSARVIHVIGANLLSLYIQYHNYITA